MKKIVVLSGDTKSVRDMQQWFKELSEETLIESLKDPDVFRRKYCSNRDPHEDSVAALAANDASPAEDAENGVPGVDLDDLGENSERHFPISLLFVDLELIPRAPLEWVVETRDMLAKFGFSKDDEPTRIVLLGYEEADFDIDKFRHKAVDDLLLKPLEKALFLQKAELHITTGDSVQASFLFKQRTELVIEMGKDSWIEHVSEFGFAIRNPAPLAVGVYARVYSRLFGDGADAGLIGRVYRAEHHPTERGMYVCYLTYHGITASQLSQVRKFIRQDKSAHAKVPLAPPEFEGVKKSVVVIDMNADARDLISDSLRTNFANVDVKGFPSYSSFLKFCARRIPGGSLDTSAGAASDEKKAASGEDAAEGEARGPARLTLAGGSEISFLIDAATMNLMSLDPMPKVTAKVLGVTVEDLLERGSAWISLFGDADKEEIKEFISYIRVGQTGNVIVSADAGANVGVVRLRIRGRIERSGDVDGVMILRLTFREMSEEEYKVSHGPAADAEVGVIDAIYVDGSLLGEDPGRALEGMAEVLRRAQLMETRDALTVTILNDERSRIRPAEFRLKSVQDFLYKPLDRKMVLAKAALLTKGLAAKTESVDLAYRKAGQPVRITKEVLMEELSEFGLQIRHETPLREQTFLRFFSSIFLDRGDGLLGRCLHSSKDPDTGQYHCFFSFFGVSDAQLKHIRNWIRGDYASKKEKAGG
ncbi:MAG: hypothetical protein NDI61_10935 [Bdellovibrionaceae bacterium]|nr:hypothetical protein [Pseudobdellovibrionaceae bacterium]